MFDLIFWSMVGIIIVGIGVFITWKEAENPSNPNDYYKPKSQWVILVFALIILTGLAAFYMIEQPEIWLRAILSTCFADIILMTQSACMKHHLQVLRRND